MDKTTVIQILKKRTDATSQSDVAKEIGVSIQFINDVLNRRRAPSRRILEYLGLKRDIVKIK